MELVNMMSVTGKEELKIVIAGKQYYAGFVEYTSGGEVLPESLIGWGNFYYTGNRNNTDAGFNGVPNLFDSQWGAIRLLPRYNIANNEPNTLNWWIILTPHSQGASCVRILECFICDEQENCISQAIPIPNALNVINVADNLPAWLFSSGTFPKAGFALCDVAMQSQVISNDGCSAIRDDKIVGWLYQYTDGTALFRDKATMLPIHVQHQSTE
jgi:hypothetical protein